MNILDYLADKLSDLFLLFDNTTDKIASGAVGRINLMNDENLVTPDQYQDRLNVCSKCDDCVNEVCRLCGCPVKKKAMLKESKRGTCPNGLWEVLNN